MGAGDETTASQLVPPSRITFCCPAAMDGDVHDLGSGTKCASWVIGPAITSSGLGESAACVQTEALAKSEDVYGVR